MIQQSNSSTIKQFYNLYYDQIASKRFNSPYWIRRYAHRRIYESILNHIEQGKKVLDVGCGDGSLSILMAQKGAIVTGIDISYPNISSAQRYIDQLNTSVNIKFLVGDAENIPFPDNSFDIVVSSHVLEHLPNFYQGLRELYRVTRHKAIIALPTCLNLCALALIGKDIYWVLSKRSLIGLPLGFARTLFALCRGIDGPNEGYAGHGDFPHIWRFPWVMKRQIRDIGFNIFKFEASTLLLPYITHYIPILRPAQINLDRLCCLSIFNYLGYGSLGVCFK